MIDDVIWFVAGCWAAGLVLSACKLDKPVIALACGGIPFHELSHLAACLALGVRVQSITLLHVDEAGARGNVKPRDEVRNPFTALVVSFAPAVGAVFWTLLFAWGVAAVSDAGYDQAWAWLLLYLAVATGTCAASSGGDLAYAWAAIAWRPGQFLVGPGGSALVGWICWACGFPLGEWWHLALLVVAVLGPGVAMSKVYGWRRGV
jgi:hypothetical protein